MIRRPQPPGWIAILPVLWVLLGVIALLAIGALFAPVRAQDRSMQTIPVACAETPKVKAALSGVAEQVMAQGVTVNNAEMELWVNPKTRTFSVVVRMPHGVSCLVISGDGLEHGDMPKGDPS